ncbi:MAG: glutamine amidotransferase [Mariniblastus sp.]
MDTLTFQPILSPLVLAIIFAAALLMLMVGPSFAKLTISRRLTLTLLRLGVILMALLAMMRPGCVQKIEKNQAALLLFLVDQSRSMQLPHDVDESTRWGTAVDMIKGNESRFAKLAENKIDCKFFTFDNQKQPIEIVDGVVKLPAKPDGGETDIGTNIYEVSLGVRDQRLLAMFVATDGQQNVPEPDVELAQAVEQLVDMEVPLMAVTLGAPSSSEQLADIEVANFSEQLIVNKNNDLYARATLVARGYPNQDITVQLIVTDSNGKEETVATEIYRPTEAFEETNLELKYRPTEPGEYRIKVRALPMSGERAKRNNELEGFLTVRDEGMRVLFINGSPGLEQKFLRASLPALDFVEMDFEPIYSFDRDKWPLTKFEKDFADPDKYDVFIFCNVDSTALHDKNEYTASLDALRRNVIENGKGLLMLGGSHSFGAGKYHQTPLADILPIEMKPTERQGFDEDVRVELHVNTPVKLIPTRDHFLTRIADAGMNKRAWADLPELAGANRLEVKETAEVYLRSDDNVKRPILVGAKVGGRVLAFAGDTSWRWVRHGYQKEYNQFWRQVILWLAFWDSRSDESVSIELPKRRFSSKGLVKFNVSVRTLAGEAVDDVEFDASLVLPSGERQPITISRNGERFESTIEPELLANAGVYEIFVSAKRNGVEIGSSKREFVVMDRDKEKANPAANPEQMARLANETSEFGGRVFVPEQLSEILDEYINNPPMTKIEIPMKWRLDENLPTPFLLIFVGLLGTEWLLRKKWGLV